MFRLMVEQKCDKKCWDERFKIEFLQVPYYNFDNDEKNPRKKIDHCFFFLNLRRD